MNKVYDLEERTFVFSKDIRIFLFDLRIISNQFEDMNQLVRSSGSIGANYIEANEALSKKDYYHRVKICRKETKETIYWLKLLLVNGHNLTVTRERLITEAIELMKIFGAIISKSASR